MKDPHPPLRMRRVELQYKGGAVVSYYNAQVQQEQHRAGRFLNIVDSNDGPFTESLDNLSEVRYVL